MTFLLLMGANHSRHGRHQQPQQMLATAQQQATASADLMIMDCYVIRLQPEQSVGLYGFLRSKTTLTWRDVLENPPITLGACVAVGITTFKLQKLQPSIKEWIQNGKATLRDCEYMEAWRPNPFLDLGCNIGDLVLYRSFLTPQMLINSGITFEMLQERYGLTPDIMQLLRYSVDDWLQLEIPPDFLDTLHNDHWIKIFGMIKRQDLKIQAVSRRQQQLSQSSSLFSADPSNPQP